MSSYSNAAMAGSNRGSYPQDAVTTDMRSKVDAALDSQGQALNNLENAVLGIIGRVQVTIAPSQEAKNGNGTQPCSPPASPLTSHIDGVSDRMRQLTDLLMKTQSAMEI